MKTNSNISRYRFSRSSASFIIVMVKNDLAGDTRGGFIPPHLKVLAAIRTWARGEIQDDAGDLSGMSQPTICIICRLVALAIVAHRAEWIQTAMEQNKTIADFYSVCGFRQVIGAIDCTHIRIPKVAGDVGQYYIDRKGYISINVQYDAMELPGQQIPSSHASTPLDHVLNLNLKAAPACQRLTGIIATMGKSTMDLEIMQQMMAAGMNVALLNLTFGSKEDHVDCIKMLRQAAKNFSVVMGKNYPLTIAATLPGRKIRTGRISDTLEEPVELKTGDIVRLTTDETYKDRCSMYTVYVDFMYFADQMHKNDIVLLDNETIMLRVDMISATTLTCKIERGGMLGSNKDVFVPNVIFHMPNYAEKDLRFIDMIVHHQLDFVVAPFANNKEAVLELRDLLGEKGRKIGIIANIQTVEGFDNFDSIIEVCNGIMITRQELGSDITPKKLILAQKNMIARANTANVPICVHAALLSSMREKRIPLRAELFDISNCILDGADAIVLAAETAVGLYPVETVINLASACKEAESCVWNKQIFRDMIDKTPVPCDQTTGAAIAAVLAVQRTLAAAIVVVTTTGKSAQVVSKYKPRCPIMAVTRYPQIARRMHLWRGVMPVVYEDQPDPDWHNDLDKRINFCTKWAMERGFVRIGDPLAVISGWRQGTGFNNTMKILYAAADTTAS